MLRDDINNAVKDAMRAKDERKLSTLRMVNSTIKNADIAARGEGKPPLSDADLLGVFQKMIKQRQESVELYDKGRRAGRCAGHVQKTRRNHQAAPAGPDLSQGVALSEFSGVILLGHVGDEDV